MYIKITNSNDILRISGINKLEKIDIDFHMTKEINDESRGRLVEIMVRYDL